MVTADPAERRRVRSVKPFRPTVQIRDKSKRELFRSSVRQAWRERRRDAKSIMRGLPLAGWLSGVPRMGSAQNISQIVIAFMTRVLVDGTIGFHKRHGHRPRLCPGHW